MRLHSTPESSRKLEISILSCVETVLAIALWVGIAWYFETVKHFIGSAILAPVLLLRTDRSTKKGIQFFKKVLLLIEYFRKTILGGVGIGLIGIIGILVLLGLGITVMIVGSSGIAQLPEGGVTILMLKILGIAGVILVGVVLASGVLQVFGGIAIGVFGEVGRGGKVGGGISIIVGSIFSKISATIYLFTISPLDCLHNIPQNWYRIIFSTDIFLTPEIIPGIENMEENDEKLSAIRFSVLTKVGIEFFKLSGLKNKFTGFSVFLAIIIIYFLPLAYRFSLKSSSLIWLPLIYIVQPIKYDNKNSKEIVSERVKDIRYGAISWITLRLSIVILAFIVIKVLLFAEWNKWNIYWQKYAPTIVDIYVGPKFIYPWHITSLLNAIITIFIFIWAHNITLNPNRYKYRTVDFVVKISLFLKRALTISTSANTILILFHIVNKLKYLEFKWQWIPD